MVQLLLAILETTHWEARNNQHKLHMLRCYGLMVAVTGGMTRPQLPVITTEKKIGVSSTCKCHLVLAGGCQNHYDLTIQKHPHLPPTKMRNDTTSILKSNIWNKLPWLPQSSHTDEKAPKRGANVKKCQPLTTYVVDNRIIDLGNGCFSKP